MKKIILGTLAIGMCLTMTACGTTAKTDSAVTSLSNQLDHTANIISNVETVSPTQITAEQMSDYATFNASAAQSNLTNEEYYKIDILNKTATIKNNLAGLKLSKIQASAVQDLTDNLAKYTNSVSNSKTELTNTIKSISSLKKNYAKNEDRINAKLNRLANNSNARLSYYQNILSTLDQLQQYIKADESKSSSNLGKKIIDVKDIKSDSTKNETTENSKTENSKTETKATLQKNIDTYLPESTCPACGEKVNGKVCPKCGKEVVVPARPPVENVTYPNGTYPINNTPIAPINNFANGGFGYNAYRANNPSNPYGFNSNSINHVAYPYSGNYGYYGGNYGYGAYNPNRNTDSYAPYMRNIDTYRGFGYGGNMNGNATFVTEDTSKSVPDEIKENAQEIKVENTESVQQKEDLADDTKSVKEESPSATETISTEAAKSSRRWTGKRIKSTKAPDHAKAHYENELIEQESENSNEAKIDEKIA